MTITPELVGGVASVLITTAGYAWRVYLAYRERRAYMRAVQAAAGSPEALAALAKLDVPRLGGAAPTALLLVGAGAGLLASAWPWSAGAQAQLPPQCSPSTCRPPARCNRGLCEADALPGPTSDNPLPSWAEHSPGMDPFARLLSPAGTLQ